MAFKSTAASILLTLFYLCLPISWILGLIHSFNSHSKTDFVICLTPFGIYRGVESFWHKNEDPFKDIDWNKRLESDVYIMYQLMAASPEKNELVEMDEALEKFADRIKDYPKEKKDYLNKAAKQYTRFVFAAARDMGNYYKKLLRGDDIDNRYWSIESKPIMDSIINSYRVTEFIDAYREMDSSMNIITDAVLERGNTEDLRTILQMGDKIKRIDEEKHSRFYKKVFNETISFRQYSL